MSNITSLLDNIPPDQPQTPAQILAQVYDELRKLAAHQLAHEAPGQTLQPTALVHEAYLRLVGNRPEQHWHGRRHFFAAAAEAMRRILIDNARRKQAAKRGGNLRRHDLDPDHFYTSAASDDLLALSEALDRLSEAEPRVAELVKLRYFAGLSIPQAAATLDISPRTADAWWAYARAWLLGELEEGDG